MTTVCHPCGCITVLVLGRIADGRQCGRHPLAPSGEWERQLLASIGIEAKGRQRTGSPPEG